MWINIIWLIIGLLLGVIVSVILYKQIEKMYLKWLSLKKKAVRGSIHSGYLKNREKDLREMNADVLSISRPGLSEGKDDVFHFEDLKMPYENIRENMTMKRAQNEIFSKAIENKYGVKYDIGGFNYRLHVTKSESNTLIPIEELDLKTEDVDLKRYEP